MLSESDIEAAHPDAFDFVWGNLPVAKRAEFNRHLSGCHYCRAVVDEYSEVGRIIKLLPPHAEPSADLEDRVVMAMTAALADDRAEHDQPGDAEDKTATRVYQIPHHRPSAVPDTQIRPRSIVTPPEPPAEQAPPGEAPAELTVTRLPPWGRYRRRFAAIGAAAAAVIIAAIIASISLGRGPAGVTVAIKLHAAAAARAFGVAGATGEAVAHQADQSWTFDLTVQGLKVLPGNDVYTCWWTLPGATKTHPHFVNGGSFVVGDSGSTTLTMTTGVDPRQFSTMEITAESPTNGALNGPVLLVGESTP